ncbi:MAG: DUF364 domain-containing protein [Burkholderiaceae bacterium]
MTIALQTQQLLEDAFTGLEVPFICGLHLPPSPWNQTRDGEFGAIELDDATVGLFYVLLDDTLATLTQPHHRESVIGRDALSVASWWAHETGIRRTIGFAAVNALSRHLLNRCKFSPPTADDSIGGLNPRAGEHIGMIGLFPSLTKQVVGAGAKLTVLELRSQLAGDHSDFRVTLNPADLTSCDKILSTSTVLLNNSFDSLWPHFAKVKEIALIGPGASCLPDSLFARGITAMGGTWIENTPEFVNALVTGEPWSKDFARKFTLRSDAYPGIDSLLRYLNESMPRNKNYPGNFFDSQRKNA